MQQRFAIGWMKKDQGTRKKNQQGDFRVRGLSLRALLGTFMACAGLAALTALTALSAQAAVTSELQHAIRAATFEVVMKKTGEGSGDL